MLLPCGTAVFLILDQVFSIKINQFNPDLPLSLFPPCVDRLRYEERAGLAQNPLGKQLLELMARKRSNLSVAADVATVEEMLELADKVS